MSLHPYWVPRRVWNAIAAEDWSPMTAEADVSKLPRHNDDNGSKKKNDGEEKNDDDEGNWRTRDLERTGVAASCRATGRASARQLVRPRVRLGRLDDLFDAVVDANIELVGLGQFGKQGGRRGHGQVAAAELHAHGVFGYRTRLGGAATAKGCEEADCRKRRLHLVESSVGGCLPLANWELGAALGVFLLLEV
ncbi:hypothetical protein DCS_04560 [Drechmeria coniospora]|uniref:Uncharacterized protein n=1 Tax=Drechmeria coniospora TaxID=98403 RepID=A0A151GKD2_DRECN|nr:hypothetical protein DCS_04560 [Drechmeria coniospora]KYK57549.1 hypothetical protein DCS_04560 [Drechmeria coniospora]